ncbi:MAG TPA: hypothetical protein VML96_03490 [Egibacteraceae bacterium]|nr:hypothetical protein [Egibacteraceae bacterium]
MLLAGLASSAVGLWSLIARDDVGAQVLPEQEATLSPAALETATAPPGTPTPTSQARAASEPSPTSTALESSGAPATPEPSSEPSLTPAPPADVSCANTDFGFALSYPGTWHTAERDPSETCRFFHPSRFAIPADYDVAEVAIRIEFLEVDYDEWVDLYRSPELVVHERIDGTVAGGARATRFLYSYPDDEASSFASYVIDRGVDVVIMEGSSQLSPDFDGTRAVLDAMAASLEFFQ